MSAASDKRCLLLQPGEGQSQSERRLPALAPQSAPVDGRDLADWVKFVQELAVQVNYVAALSNVVDGNWSLFFADLPAELQRSLGYAHGRQELTGGPADRGDLPPHLGLLVAFLRLLGSARNELNGLTARHLEHFYHEVLRLKALPPQPDQAHLLVSLKKKVTEAFLAAGTRVSAGKDATGKALQFALVDDLSVFPVGVTGLRSLFRGGDGRLHQAPIADSADGLGGELAEGQSWPPFGAASLPVAPLGFAFAAPVLAMAEGARTIEVELALANLPSGVDFAKAGKDAMQAYLTGAKGWIGPRPVSLEPHETHSGSLQLSLTLPAEDEAVANYDPTLHGHGFDTRQPLLQLLFNEQKADLTAADLAEVKLSAAEIRVIVSGIETLQLDSDFGPLDAKKPFLPFGPQPVRGAQFHVGYPEAFGKQLESFSLQIQWQDAPVSFSSIYNKTAYTVSSNADFTAKLRARLAGQGEKSYEVELFETNASSERTIAVPPPTHPWTVASLKPGKVQRALSLKGQKSGWALRQVQVMPLLTPLHWYYPALLRGSVAAPQLRNGGVTLRLVNDFKHKQYPELYTAAVLAAAGGAALDLPNEPYTPVIETLRLSYTATSGRLDFSDSAGHSAPGEQLAFFQVDPFGQRRDHPFLRRQLPFVSRPSVPLFAEHEHEGEFFIGISGVPAGRNLSLLLQVAEGSGDPDLLRPPVEWSLLADNHWRPLTAEELLADGSDGLVKSGVLRLALPPDASDRNTLLPAGSYWLRAAVKEHSAALCRLLAVAPNAVLARFADAGNDPQRLRQPLAAGRLAKLAVPVPGIQKVSQPYASFGGQMEEDESAFRVRVSERLRHKQRAVTPWDVERLVLQQFPRLYKVRCLSHTAPDSCEAPGHLTLVVIPDLRNRNAVDPLQPRADLATLEAVRRFLAAHCGPRVQVHVENPRYRPVLLDFKVRFQPGLDFGHYRKELERELVAFLSPWAFDAGAGIHFGGRIHKTVIIHFLEQRNYVDYLTDVRLFLDGDLRTDLPAAQVDTPRGILVSAPGHRIDRA